jgi:hypothetical protein
LVFDQIIALVGELAWPIVILIIVLAFRREVSLILSASEEFVGRVTTVRVTRNETVVEALAAQYGPVQRALDEVKAVSEAPILAELKPASAANPTEIAEDYYELVRARLRYALGNQPPATVSVEIASANQLAAFLAFDGKIPMGIQSAVNLLSSMREQLLSNQLAADSLSELLEKYEKLAQSLLARLPAGYTETT